MSTGVEIFLLIARVTSSNEFNSDCRFNSKRINSSSPEISSVFCIPYKKISKLMNKFF